MTAIQYIAGGVGLLVIAGPVLHKLVSLVVDWKLAGVGHHDPAESAVPAFEESVSHLAHVRSRLVQTDLLSDDTRKAIDVLTLALVAGSDK